MFFCELNHFYVYFFHLKIATMYWLSDTYILHMANFIGLEHILSEFTKSFIKQ